eukprot:9298436-Alexandrium_andersonii.AAC.1
MGHPRRAEGGGGCATRWPRPVPPGPRPACGGGYCAAPAPLSPSVGAGAAPHNQFGWGIGNGKSP